jgi:tetratricopeptide (TPR) repeat protein
MEDSYTSAAMKTRICLFAIVCSLLSTAAAQESGAGEEALAKKDYGTAERFFRQALQSNKDSGQAWFSLGDALYGEQKFSDAAEAYGHAASLNFQGMRSQFRQAKSLARAGQNDRAFQALTELNRQDFPNLNALTSDNDFATLRSDKRWQQVVDATTANATPCEHTAENRQFDFWIGEWNVETTTGQPAGSSKVERILNGCALLESWSGAGDGKSLNIYNANKKQWQQFWVDAGGEVHEYAGNLVNGEMKFEGPAADRAGNRTMRRMTFTKLDGGRVRQRGEVSPDGTKWSVEYDLTYVPKS